MTRPSNHTHRGDRTVVASDRKVGTPVVPDTEPLPSDAISSPVVPVVPDAALATSAGIETAPLPVPEAASGADVVTTDPKPPLVHVDATIPLPSDQMTAKVSPVGTTDVSATTRAAIATEGADVLREDFAERFWNGMSGEERIAERRPEMERRASGVITSGAVDSVTSNQRHAMQLLRDELERAGFGVVILSADTVDALRSFLRLPPLSGSHPVEEPYHPAEAEERRRFRVSSHVHHNGKHVAPGGSVLVTRAEFERYRDGGSIAVPFWAHGEED